MADNNQSRSHKKENVSAQIQEAAVVPPNLSSDQSNGADGNKVKSDTGKCCPEDNSLPWYKRPEWISVLITAAYGVITLVIAIAAVCQARAGVKQGELMRLALAESKRSSEAAISNAKAAVASVRPLLIVVIERDPDDSAGWIVRAVNKGKSAAVLWGANCCFDAHPTEGFVPPDLLKCPIWLPPENVIIPDADFLVMKSFSPSRQSPSPEDLLNIINPSFYYIYGCIQYQDMFSDRNAPGAKPYETRWQFHYDFSKNRFIRSAGPYPRNT